MGQLAARRIGDFVDGHPFRVGFAVLAAVGNLTRPVAVAFQCLPHLAVERRVVNAGSQDARVFAKHFTRRIAGDQGKRGVDRNNTIVLIGNHDRVGTVVEYFLGQQQAFVRLFALGDVDIGADHAHRLFIAVAFDEDLRVEVADLPVGLDDPEVDVEVVGASVMASLQGRVDQRQVVRMHLLHPVPVCVVVNLRVDAVELEHAGIPDHRVAGQIPVPDADCSGRGGQGQSFGNHLQCQFGAFACGDVGVGGDEAATLQGGAADLDDRTVRPCPFEMVRDWIACLFDQGVGQGFRVARAIFAALRIEQNDIAHAQQLLCHELGRELKQSAELLIETDKIEIAIDQRYATGYVFDNGVEQRMLPLQLGFRLFAVGDVDIGGDEAGELAVDIVRPALDQVGSPVAPRVLEAVRCKAKCQIDALTHLFLGVARPVFADSGAVANQILESHTRRYQFRRQAKHVDQARVPQLQAQFLIKNTDPHWQVFKYGRELYRLPARLFLDTAVFGHVLCRAGDGNRVAGVIAHDAAGVFEATDFA